MHTCPSCGSDNVVQFKDNKSGDIVYSCVNCGNRWAMK